jgi:16S rRNA G966 N2-methylase RsmD
MSEAAWDHIGTAHLSSWLGKGLDSGPSTSNLPAQHLPFQRWFKFKEAFSPSFVVNSIKRLPYQPQSCLDPFAGSGTTALTCQFLGIHPTTIEVNPFMADLVEAKLTDYNKSDLRYTFRTVAKKSRLIFNKKFDIPVFAGVPATFVEPGLNDRWIFGKDVARAIMAIRYSIEEISEPRVARLMRVILGSRLVELSNVVVNGKGRRYRKAWKNRIIEPIQVFDSFETSMKSAISDIECFRRRQCKDYVLMRGDARVLTQNSGQVDFVLTSPPYPNSFDYTDIYNIELWTLGYLNDGADNRALRKQTLRSHVQVAQDNAVDLDMSPTLSKTYSALCEQRQLLWSRNIPEMICHYFADMQTILATSKQKLRAEGHAMLAVGNSRYEGVLIDVPKILTEIAENLGFSLVKIEAVRSMRSSAQQGGRFELNESLVWLKS